MTEEIKTLNITNLSFKIIEIKVDKKINAEDWVKKHYSSKGFCVTKLTKIVDSDSWKIIPRELVRIRYDELIGTPDFLVFKENKDEEIKEFFFVEAKTDNDGLTYNQMKWIKNHPNIPVMVVHIKQEIGGQK